MGILDTVKLHLALGQAELLRRQYHATQDLDHLNGAIEQFEGVLHHPGLASLGDRQLVGLQNMAAQSVRERYNRLGSPADLDRALELWEDALLVSRRMDNPGFQASFLNNLALGSSEKFRVTGDSAMLDRAVEFARRALESTDPRSPDFPKHLNTHGLRYMDRFQVGRSLGDLEQAIRDFRRALSLTNGPELQAIVQHNLGAALVARFDRYGDRGDAEEAIRLTEQALANTREGTHEYLQTRHSLALRVHLVFRATGDPVYLSRAIEHLQYVLAHAAPDSSLYDIAIRNLANHLSDRFHATGDATDLEQAILRARESVARTGPRSPIRAQRLADLGQRWHERYLTSGDEADWRSSQESFREACELGLQTDPYAALKASRAWGDGCLVRGEWDVAAGAYGFGVEAIDRLYQAQLDRQGKESWLSAAVGFHAHLAYACARTSRLEEAVAHLEHGRAFILSEQLELRRADLERLPALGHQELYDRYLRSRTRRMLVQDSDVDTIQQAQEELQRAVAEIQRIEGFHDFFRRPTFSGHVLPAVPVDAAFRLVYTAVTRAGGLALVVSPGGGVDPVWLDGLDESTVRQRVLDYREAYGRLDDPAGWGEAIERTTRWLWDALIGPVTDSLRPPGPPARNPAHLVLIPQGWLGFLPLHAAWTEVPGSGGDGPRRRYAADEWLITYAPNARSLRSPPGPLDSLCAVENPDSTLQFAGPEVSWALEHFGGRHHSRLDAESATRANVMDGLARHSVTHFATHGWYDADQPLNSYLRLKDGDLTLRDILGLTLDDHPRLAILSACETGIPSPDVPDEVMSLGAGLLQAGLRGVVSSLWSVSDVSTMLLMSHMYVGWTRRGLSVAEALRQAQCWLRTASQSEVTDMFHQVRATLGPAERDAYEAAVQAARWSWYEDPPYGHPHYWAAFTFTGAWS